jgi:hypothetical protein
VGSWLFFAPFASFAPLREIDCVYRSTGDDVAIPDTTPQKARDNDGISGARVSLEDPGEVTNGSNQNHG